MKNTGTAAQVVQAMEALAGAAKKAAQALDHFAQEFVRAFSPLKNLRHGLATNSSSSHSLVYLREPVPYHDIAPRYADAEFGRGDFRLIGLRDKLFYVLVSMVGANLYWDDNGEQKAEADKAYAKYASMFPELTYADFHAAVTGYVDHESRGFVTSETARDPHVVIFGGSDHESDLRTKTMLTEQVDWSRTMPRWSERTFVPPAMRKCAECGQKVWDHSWTCSRNDEEHGG